MQQCDQYHCPVTLTQAKQSPVLSAGHKTESGDLTEAVKVSGTDTSITANGNRSLVVQIAENCFLNGRLHKQYDTQSFV
jgi:hypothetical protein